MIKDIRYYYVHQSGRCRIYDADTDQDAIEYVLNIKKRYPHKKIRLIKESREVIYDTE